MPQCYWAVEAIMSSWLDWSNKRQASCQLTKPKDRPGWLEGATAAESIGWKQTKMAYQRAEDEVGSATLTVMKLTLIAGHQRRERRGLVHSVKAGQLLSVFPAEQTAVCSTHRHGFADHHRGPR